MTQSRSAKFVFGLVVIVGLLVGRRYGGAYLSFDFLKSQHAHFLKCVSERPISSAFGYAGIVVSATALSFPGVVVLALAGGALFGLGEGIFLVSCSSTLGASLAFLSSRYFLKARVEERFSEQMKAVNRGVSRDGALYLFNLRLVPVVPFWLINLLMGLTQMSVFKFAWVTQLGTLIVTVLLVNAGTKLAQIQNLSGLFSTQLLVSLGFMAALPLLTRQILSRMRPRESL